MRQTVSVKPSANNFCGVFGVAKPGEALRRMGVEPAWQDTKVAFGGAPVWTDTSGNFVLIGEVVLYNAPELRKALELPEAEPGELLAQLVGCYGAKAGLHAQGMFAVAVWDKRQEQLLLLRDSLGARTLYYADEGARACWFAARLRTLRHCPAVSSELSLEAIRHYLICAFVPGEQTLWQDIRELRPGTARLLPDHEMQTYWQPTEGEWNADEPLETYASRLRPGRLQ